MMTEHEDLIERLRRVEPAPVPPATASAHLTAMALAAAAPRRRFRRAAIASTAFAGFILGSTGLAAAGALPGAVQGVAHDALAQVSIEVPDRRGDSGSDVTRSAEEGDAERTQAVDQTPRTGDCETAEARQPSAAGDLDGRVDDTEPRTGDTDPRGAEPGWVDPEPTEEELAARLEQRANATCGDGSATERDGDAAETDRPGEPGTTDRTGDAGTTDRTGDTGTTDRTGDTSTTERTGDTGDTAERTGDTGEDGAARP